jgi:hypothetical protein
MRVNEDAMRNGVALYAGMALAGGAGERRSTA